MIVRELPKIQVLITLLKHERMEQSLMKQGLSQRQAHIQAETKYNYSKESRDYYAKTNQH